jgi:hypothetical protein
LGGGSSGGLPGGISGSPGGVLASMARYINETPGASLSGWLAYAFPNPDPTLFAVQQLVSTADVLADRVGFAIEVTGAGFQFEIKRQKLGTRFIKNRRVTQLGVRCSDFRRITTLMHYKASWFGSLFIALETATLLNHTLDRGRLICLNRS